MQRAAQPNAFREDGLIALLQLGVAGHHVFQNPKVSTTVEAENEVGEAVTVNVRSCRGDWHVQPLEDTVEGVLEQKAMTEWDGRTVCQGRDD